MSAVVADGIQALTVVGGVQVICTSTQAGSFVLSLDASPLTTVDILLVEVKRKLRTGSTLRTILKHTIRGVDIDAGMEPLHQSIPIASAGFSYVAQLTLTVGAGTRNIEFSVELV